MKVIKWNKNEIIRLAKLGYELQKDNVLLKAALQEAQEEIDSLMQEKVESLMLQNALKQSRDREIVLQSKIEKLQETYTDESGLMWEPPTAFAYAKACIALNKHYTIITTAREELTKNCIFLQAENMRVARVKKIANVT